ncbi:MAG TPA: HAMP domain-containing sensor histidine kinase [Bryobacteraceae bacterium]|jgi:two-component system sensor histidine kinase CpxA|nr:HAMP domain-containing sensor histidine kinase [Bryobacteraceae bacterium]
MSSVFVKSLVWFLLTLAVCLTGSAITNELRYRFAPGRHDFFSRSFSFQLDRARNAYETGGRAALQEYLDNLQTFMPGSYTLLDSHGRDLLTGTDRRAEMKRIAPPSIWNPLPRSPRTSIAWPTHDRRYWLVMDMPTPGVAPRSPVPFWLWIALATTVFYYILAVQLAAPVRTLEQTVEKFGRGDLRVRAASKRRDEIGNLARAFNVMADRIETLLTAERRLLQDVSHELRSPLARLEFAVELARTSPDRERALDRIRKEVGRLSTLVSELLQVTRAESDPDSRNLDIVELTALLRDVVGDCSVEADARKCRLVLHAECDLALRGDRELLRRAIENILRNAIRYAPEGTPVELRLERSVAKASLFIRDYGPGVPDESLENLFKPFYRVETDRSRTNSGGGVGLGLSIAQRAISVHNGAIVARNAQPGLLVRVDLPLLPVATEVSTA